VLGGRKAEPCSPCSPCSLASRAVRGSARLRAVRRCAPQLCVPLRALVGGAGPGERVVGGYWEFEMLRIYEVVLAMVGGAARIAEEIERRDSDLARQMRRAAASVALNTAEGMGNTGGHKRQRYQTALGSAREVSACIDVAKAMRYVGEVDAVTLDRIDHVIATLAKLVYHRK
jgi:four helix bundle protein